jgi:hypothetical protein
MTKWGVIGRFGIFLDIARNTFTDGLLLEKVANTILKFAERSTHRPRSRFNGMGSAAGLPVMMALARSVAARNGSSNRCA